MERSAPAVTGRDMFGQPVTVEIRGERIHSVRAADPAEPAAGDAWVLPGLVDLQVNGFGGYDLNRAGVTPEDVAGVVRALWPHGVTRCCPTVCTASREQMTASLRAIARACDEIGWVDRAVAGVHVEGPYISPEDGPRGVHPKEHVRAPDWAEIEAFQEAAGGRVRVLTLAPEWPGALEVIERLAREGVVPAIGHTNAPRAALQAAVSAGARLSTHLGNGAHALLPRHPNYIWDQLAADALWASFIADGHHLPPAVVKVFVRAKGAHRCVLVSDAIWLAGQPPGTYQFLGGSVELTPTRKVQLTGTPYLAGSALDLLTAVDNTTRFAGVGLADAVAMASRQPAALLGRGDLGGLAPGQCADIVVARRSAVEGRLEAVQTIVGGDIVWTR